MFTLELMLLDSLCFVDNLYIPKNLLHQNVEDGTLTSYLANCYSLTLFQVHLLLVVSLHTRYVSYL